MGNHNIFIGKETTTFKNIFDMYYKGLCLFAQSYSLEMEQAEDIVQDVFVKICEKNVAFTSKSSLKSYLYQAVKNNITNTFRKQEVHRKFKDWIRNKPEEEKIFFQTMIEEDSYRILFQAIDKLPDRPREVILLSLEGMKNQEIADFLSISLNTVRTHKAKALKLLKNHLGHLNPMIFVLLFILPE